MKILFTGGGTGGHLTPLIGISRELVKLHPENDVRQFYLGPKDELSQGLLEQENIKVFAIASGKIRRYFSLRNIVDIAVKIPWGFFQSLFWLIVIWPDLVVSKGGTGALQAAMAAHWLGIPVFIHESDIVPGLSNRQAARWAKKVFTSFEKTEYVDLEKAVCVGNPIRAELLAGSAVSAKEFFRLAGGKPVLLFMGGSQGAQPLNEFVLGALNEILKNYEIIHVCGAKNYSQVLAESNVVLAEELRPWYHLFASLNETELTHAYQAAGLIISRGGSSSIFEIAALGKPSILVPLPSSAGDHQSKNAYQYASTGAAVVVEQQNLTPHFFLGQINYILSSPGKLREMRKAALQFAKPLAARAIAREILEFLKK